LKERASSFQHTQEVNGVAVVVPNNIVREFLDAVDDSAMRYKDAIQGIIVMRWHIEVIEIDS
jgi:hypothetical protein